MTTEIKYLIDQDRITFYRENQISVVEKGSAFQMYESIKEALVNNQETLYFNPKQFLLEAFDQRKDMFGIADRIKQIEEAGMPTEPYRAFVSRLSDSVFKGHGGSDLIETLMQKIGTVEAPLTWNGDIVLYQRSAWTKGEIISWAEDESFTPFNVISGKTQRAGEFSYSMRACPDTGCAYEVVVQPQHIKEINNYGLWTVSQVMQLAQLGKEMTTMQRSESPIVRYETKCVGDSNIVMRLPYSPQTAATVAEFMLRYNNEMRVVEAPVLQAVSC